MTIARAQSVSRLVNGALQPLHRETTVRYARTCTQEGAYTNVVLAVDEDDPAVIQLGSWAVLERAIGAIVLALNGRYDLLNDGLRYDFTAGVILTTTLVIEAES